MSVPTIFDWLDRFSFLRGNPAAYAILITAVIVFVAWDWRIMLLSLMVQYMIAGFLFVDLLSPLLVNLKVLTGLFVCLMLYLTARQVNWGRLPVDVSEDEASRISLRGRAWVGPSSLPTSMSYRLFLTLLMLLVVSTLVQRPEYQLPAVPAELDHITLAVYALAGMGLLSMGLTTEPLQAGLGMLMFLTGFELFYSALEQSVAILLSLAAVNLLVTLAIAYLTQVRHSLPALVD